MMSDAEARELETLRMYREQAADLLNKQAAELERLRAVEAEHTCPTNDFIPCVDRPGDTLIWRYQPLAVPRYPFFCTTAGKVEWFTAEEAAGRGLVHVAYIHFLVDTPTTGT